ncbi:hypothetical protein FVA74_04225 [Salinibacterium sp. dk2585]|uniref:hypothetical protein n=1 Tax=unclassified Salinibacterium TaxID=2632331 RepID=UPI0011C24B98|nr:MULTISPECIES: hypothetical protein [unclassified Salinibacterium]QEE60874.1 hypothetical protein FVA74_04225 [Salinibacterium sp. dk2585]TXK55945.1 hypothetical protein FVP63_04370 [Salinibacterium sp. dk5596]
MQTHDKTLTIVGGAMLSTCLIVGGVAAVSGNTPTRPAEVVGIDGVRGASEEIARVDKTKRFPQSATASEEQEGSSTQPRPAPRGAVPALPGSDNGPVRVPPAAPTPTDARISAGANDRAARERPSSIRQQEVPHPRDEALRQPVSRDHGPWPQQDRGVRFEPPQQFLPPPGDRGAARQAPAPEPPPAAPPASRGNPEHGQAPWGGRDGGHADGDRRGHEGRGDERRGGSHGHDGRDRHGHGGHDRGGGRS